MEQKRKLKKRMSIRKGWIRLNKMLQRRIEQRMALTMRMNGDQKGLAKKLVAET